MAEKTSSKQLKGKTILLISPDRWGEMHISKHHYAKSLAKRGNTVYFLNPPSDNLKTFATCVEIANYQNLYLVEYKRVGPKFLRFKARWLFDRLIKRLIRKLSTFIPDEIDLVWCFEPNLFSNPRLFTSKGDFIYHPVDELYYPYQYVPGESADLILASAQEYLDKFGKTKAQKVFINHGLAKYFFEASKRIVEYPNTNKLKVGYAGNMLRAEIDTEAFTEIIGANPEIEFHIWGTYARKDSNLGGESTDQAVEFVKALKSASNVDLHGAVSPKVLAEEMQNMDAFLICYDVIKDRSSGTNYHKVLEYLNTGKIVISNNVTTYKNMPEMVQMVDSRTDNDSLPTLFKEVMQNLEVHNSIELQNKRIAYSLTNSYSNQIKRIESLLYKI